MSRKRPRSVCLVDGNDVRQANRRSNVHPMGSRYLEFSTTAMRHILTVVLVVVLTLSPTMIVEAQQQSHPSSNSTIHIAIETSLGEIVVGLDSSAAPLTTGNFLRYVDAGRYNATEFYRTVRLDPDNQPNNTIKIEVIQGGVNSESDSLALPPILLEGTNVTGLKHLDGVISMARSEPNSATTEFFICIGDQPELDFGGRRNPDGQGFAAFGRVIEGMDVVRRIHHAPFVEQALTPPVRIIRMRRTAVRPH